MSDITTGQAWNTGDTVTATKMTNIIGLATINSTFISTKNPITSLQSNDNFIIARNDGSWARITGAALADGLVNAEPNFSRIAVGPLQAACPIINGDFQVFQRNISFASLGTSTATYTSDKWKSVSDGAGAGRFTASQQSSGITGTANYPDTEYCLRSTVTTTQASQAAGNYNVICQYVEQQLARVLYDNPTSLSILLRSNSTGTFCVSLRNNNGGTPNRSYVVECAITSANVWQRFTFPAIATMPTGSGTWGTSDTDYSYAICVCLGAGSTFQTTAGSWNTGNFVATSNQTNLFVNNGATLDIALVQHELGSVVTPFVWTPFDINLLRSKRYYQKSYPYGVYAGAVSSLGNIVNCLSIGTSDTASTISFVPNMRIAPVVTIYSTSSGTSGKIRDATASADITASATGITDSGFNDVTSSAAYTTLHQMLAQWQADIDF